MATEAHENSLLKLLKLQNHKKKKTVRLPLAEVEQILEQALAIIKQQPPLLELDPPVNICGDIHGQFLDLLRMMEEGGTPPQKNYLFLGDYVDRGRNSTETVLYLLIHKIRYPENIFMLRGNHECIRVNSVYGFLSECRERYNLSIYLKFNELFAYLPVAAVVGDAIFCCHGGLSPFLMTVEEIRELERPIKSIPDRGLVCDLLWADPGLEVTGFVESDRGVSHLFGPDVLENFLQKNNLDLVCRAHQVIDTGYEFFCGRRLVTLFSAPNYCGEYDNAGAMMVVDDDLSCYFKIVRPVSC